METLNTSVWDNKVTTHLNTFLEDHPTHQNRLVTIVVTGLRNIKILCAQGEAPQITKSTFALVEFVT